MMCVSECPTGVFQIRTMDFYSIMGELRKIRAPVLSCHVRPGLAAHEKTVCLGFLSEEHLIALMSFLRNPLQMNLTECKDCRNDLVAAALRGRLRSVAEKTFVNALEKIKLVEEKADLHYADVSCDRRGFFKALKNRAVRKALGLLDNTKTEGNTLSYSDKTLPHRRDLLNRSLSGLPGDMRQGGLEHYYYNIEVDETCNDCFACVGVCPTGALKSAEDESDATLFFNSSLCTGCGLCGSFCRNNTVRMRKGFSGVLPFQFKGAKGGFRRGDSEVHRGSHVEGAFADR
ncbi:MAG: hypothetical protein KAJ09_02560 [Deltaproteobacteria bacterium]|nr:hypothetical protein [Deltaproteobacteria bacterium]